MKRASVPSMWQVVTWRTSRADVWIEAATPEDALAINQRVLRESDFECEQKTTAFPLQRPVPCEVFHRATGPVYPPTAMFGEEA